MFKINILNGRLEKKLFPKTEFEKSLMNDKS